MSSRAFWFYIAAIAVVAVALEGLAIWAIRRW
jgi:hypothetical protein